MNQHRPLPDGRAQQHELLAHSNPAHGALMHRLFDEVRTWSFTTGDTLLDFGAGTGAFSLRVAAAFPQAQVIHLDASEEKKDLAAELAHERQITNIRFLCRDLEVYTCAPGSLAALLTVHTLFMLSDPQETLRRMYRWLRPGGMVLACDIGRVLRPRDWRSYIFRHARRRHGMMGAIALRFKLRHMLRLQREIRRRQESGQYWTHDLEEFRAAFERAGFEVLKDSTTYREYSDVVVARRG